MRFIVIVIGPVESQMDLMVDHFCDYYSAVTDPGYAGFAGPADDKLRGSLPECRLLDVRRTEWLLRQQAHKNWAEALRHSRLKDVDGEFDGLTVPTTGYLRRYKTQLDYANSNASNWKSPAALVVDFKWNSHEDWEADRSWSEWVHRQIEAHPGELLSLIDCHS